MYIYTYIYIFIYIYIYIYYHKGVCVNAFVYHIYICMFLSYTFIDGECSLQKTNDPAVANHSCEVDDAIEVTKCRSLTEEWESSYLSENVTRNGKTRS